MVIIYANRAVFPHRSVQSGIMDMDGDRCGGEVESYIIIGRKIEHKGVSGFQASRRCGEV